MTDISTTDEKLLFCSFCGKNQNEVKKLIKQNAHNISTSAMYKLREKYNDQDLLDAIQDGFIERTREIRKKGKKFAKMVKEKYANTIPLHMLLKKAHKFKKKYNFKSI